MPEKNFNLVIWKKRDRFRDLQPFKYFNLPYSEVLDIVGVAKKSRQVERIEFYPCEQEYTTRGSWVWDSCDRSWNWGYRWLTFSV